MNVGLIPREEEIPTEVKIKSEHEDEKHKYILSKEKHILKKTLKMLKK